MIDGHPAIIRVGFSEEPMWQRFWQLVIGLVVGLPLALGLAGIGGYHLARRALGPVERMARRAREINAEQLDARIDIENPHDELGLLAQALNETLSRLQLSFEQLKRFTSDASHELRTPLTAIRSVGEVGLQQEGDHDHYREVIGSMLEETERLSRLVESLLTISRADSGQIQLQQATIPLVPVVEEASSLLDVLAEEKGQTVSFEGDSSIRVKADTVILRQVVINLLDNAIKYSPRKGHISVRVCRCDTHTACVEVEDCGPGIAPEHRDKVFDRFYRIDEARSREAGGAGLGLALAKWGAEAHGGRLELDSTTAGCIFRLLLPVCSDAVGETSEDTLRSAGSISHDSHSRWNGDQVKPIPSEDKSWTPKECYELPRPNTCTHGVIAAWHSASRRYAACTILIGGRTRQSPAERRLYHGYIIVMRHASSPREVPDKQTANPDNLTPERQLDAEGRASATAMGKALRELKIPIGEVLSSPTYRALETIRYAQFGRAQAQEEFGEQRAQRLKPHGFRKGLPSSRRAPTQS